MRVETIKQLYDKGHRNLAFELIEAGAVKDALLNVEEALNTIIRGLRNDMKTASAEDQVEMKKRIAVLRIHVKNLRNFNLKPVFMSLKKDLKGTQYTYVREPEQKKALTLLLKVKE